ncbi:hypothetical protein [Pseudomonas sp. RL_5y_Pfl2_70]|uniref:hypothetical protein n=1 Tax=Pseudomonas sp. RL_5y_Pfl2_70 TaxID=3088712 RepID=UPI0030DBEB75
MITQLTTEFVAYATAQVNVCNGNDIYSGNDEFHGNRHTSEVNKLRAFRAVAQGLWQWSEIKKTSRWRILEPMPDKALGEWMAF